MSVSNISSWSGGADSDQSAASAAGLHNSLSALVDWAGSSSYPPHGFCLMWDPTLIALEWLGHGGTALAYVLIPVMLFWYARKALRKALMSLVVVFEFAAFILCCGVSHILHILTLYYDVYMLEAVWANVTAFVSLITVVTLPVVIIRVMRTATTEAVRKVLQDPNGNLG